jgi:hypothetical protein
LEIVAEQEAVHARECGERMRQRQRWFRKDDLEAVRRMAQENRESIDRVTKEIRRLKKRLEGTDKDRDEASSGGDESKAS